jgi:hypothetical protein
MKNNFQPAKDVVRKYYAAFDTASNSDLINVFKQYTTAVYHWRVMHPFY